MKFAPCIATFLLFISASSLLADSPAQANYYVATNGSGNIGSQNAPCSLEGVQDLVRSVNHNMTGDIHVFIRGGTYQMEKPWQFIESTDTHDSGTKGFNIIYEAFPGEKPVISGAIKITDWELFDKSKNIYRAKIPAGTQSRQFYVDDQRMVRARSDFKPTGWTKSAKGWTISDTTMQGWRNISDIEIVSRSSWKHLRCGIASITGTEVTMKTPGWNNCSHSPKPGNPFNGGGTQEMRTVEWIENAFELLKAPGQWYLDSTDDYLYFIPFDFQNMAQIDAELPVLETVLAVHGTDFDLPIHNLEFKGLSFKYGTWMQPSGDQGYADNQSGVVWTNAPPTSCKTAGNLSFQYAQNIRLERNSIGHMGGVGIDFGHGPQRNIILGNCIYDISGNGIFLGDVSDYSSTNPQEWCDQNVIKDNYITKVGVEFEDQVAICTGYTRHLLLDHNEVFDLPYTGISVGWGWSKMGYSWQNTISNNFVHEYMKILEDGGGIYTLGNQGSDGERTVWTGNYITGGKHGQGMYSDEGSGFMDINNNVVTHVGANWMNIWCNWIHDVHVHNNFSDKKNINNHGTNCQIENNEMDLSDKTISAEAQAIMNNSGLEPEYASIKKLVPIDPLTKVREIINDTDPKITYTGQWKSMSGRHLDDINDDIHFTQTEGNSASLKFYGRGIDFLTETNKDEGEVDVYIDGQLQKTVDCATDKRAIQKPIYHFVWQQEGDHEIRLEKKTGTFLIVDGFEVYHIIK